MMNRRDMLKGGLAVSALPLAARAGFAAGEPVPVVPLYRVLYDRRFPASVAFARRAAAIGLAVHGFDGDVTDFWYRDLYYRWRQEPVAIAGLTANGAMFCLERLAWDVRMRVVYRGEHSPAGDGCVVHRLSGPETMLAAARADGAGADWAAALADVVAECPRSRTARRTASLVVARQAVPASEPLYSWVIAPVTRA
jgi:hypothetical protein